MTSNTPPDHDEIDLALAGIGQLASLSKGLRAAEQVFTGLATVRQAQAEADAALEKARADLLQVTDEITRRRAAARKLPDAEAALAAKLAEIAAADAVLASRGADLAALDAQIDAADAELADRRAAVQALADSLATLTGGAT